jgi:hypothetical protein
MAKPTLVVLIAAVLLEIVNDIVGLIAEGNIIKGPTVSDMTPLKIALRG